MNTMIAVTNLTLFLLAGQSNMAGRGGMTEEDRQPFGERIVMLNKGCAWVPAKNPIHFDNVRAGVGPAYSFVTAYAKDHPDETIGLVPCAIGGTYVRTWVPGGFCFEKAKARIDAAKKAGTFKAILWLQGETDGAHDTDEELAESFKKLSLEAWSSLRKECGDEKLPVYVGEIGYFNPKCAARINPLLKEAVEADGNAKLVSAEGLEWNSKKDAWHFNRESQLELGLRFYKTLKSAQ